MRGVAVLTITGVLSQLVGFVYRIGLTRLAGAEILGLYQLILPVYSVLLSLTSVGLTTAVSNLSAWYQALGNQRAIYQVRGQAVKLFFLLALSGALLFTGCSAGRDQVIQSIRNSARAEDMERAEDIAMD